MKQPGVIGGTGIAELEGLVPVTTHDPDTPYGMPSGPISEGLLDGRRVYFLQRHGGSPGVTPPHLVNYRANLWALQSLGVTDIVAINAVGGISAAMQPGRLVIPHQLIDYTWGREHTFDDGSGPLMHIDFTEPYDRELRKALLAAASEAGIACQDAAIYGVAQGPRLETAAEIRRMAADGCDVVGMTGMPEAALARELGVAYASICMVVNPAAGLGELPISLEMMRDILQREAGVVGELLRALMRRQDT